MCSSDLDLLVQHHEFIAKYPDGRKEKIMSTMIDTGISGGDSAMSKTVGLPVAIAAKMVAQGEINRCGVMIPIYKEIYEPLLAELRTMDIKFVETKETIS